MVSSKIDKFTKYDRVDKRKTYIHSSKQKYKDFEMSFKVRLKNGGGNSGIQIRSEIANPKTFAVKGPQADIGANYWGSLYGELFGGMMKEAPKDDVNIGCENGNILHAPDVTSQC